MAGCECKAGRLSAAWRLLCKASEMVPAVKVALTDAKMHAIVDELYG